MELLTSVYRKRCADPPSSLSFGKVSKKSACADNYWEKALQNKNCKTNYRKLNPFPFLLAHFAVFSVYACVCVCVRDCVWVSEWQWWRGWKKTCEEISALFFSVSLSAWPSLSLLYSSIQIWRDTSLAVLNFKRSLSPWWRLCIADHIAFLPLNFIPVTLWFINISVVYRRIQSIFKTVCLS